MYTISGASTSDTFQGTITGLGIAAATGGLVGYAIDAFRGLTGISKSKRVSKAISNLPPKIKVSLTSLLVLGSISLNGAIYKLTPNTQANKIYESRVPIEPTINEDR